MAGFQVSGFTGENRTIHPKLLPINVGVSSLNQRPMRSDLRPLRSPTAVATVAAGSSTIYRMGRDTPSDSLTWLAWTTVVSVVRGFLAEDPSERTYYTGDGVPKWTDNIKLLTAPRLLGIPAPLTPPTVATASVGVSATTEVRYYVFTHVTDAGEESAPSPPSLALTCKTDATVNISSMEAAPTGNRGITLKRIYRTQSSSTATNFFFQQEIISSLTTASDTGQPLKEVLATTFWIPPPAGLKNLTGMWNGMMAGINGRAVRVCEPDIPYAWPSANEFVSPDSTPVGLATFGQRLVVLTTNRPRIITGGTPEGLDDQPLEFKQACVAPRSIVSLGHGVCYAAPDGLAYIGEGGSRIVTTGILSRDDWQALVPSSIIGTQYEGSYIGFYNSGAGVKGFTINPLQPGGMYFMDTGYVAACLDDIQDALYVLNGTSVQKWDTGTALTATFKSKEFSLGADVRALAWARVIADSFASVTFKLFADGVLKHTQAVSSRNPFRLPSGYHARDYQIQIETTSPVQAVSVSHSIKELTA